MIATTFFQSSGKPKVSSVITAVRQVIVLVPTIYLLPMRFGLPGIFWAQPISGVIATVLSAVLILREFHMPNAADQNNTLPQRKMACQASK